MQKISFYHCADIHLDMPFSTLSKKRDLPNLRRKKILDGFVKLINSAKVDNPDFLFISGDLFEQEYTNKKTIEYIDALLGSLLNTNVIMIAGNHDPEASNSFYVNYKWSKNVHFLGSEKNYVEFKEKNTCVYGIGFEGQQGSNNKLNDISCETNMINVLLFHGDVDIDINNSGYNPVRSELLDSKGFDYVALGHTHKIRTYGNNNRIFNPGSIEPLGFDEEGEHGYYKGYISKEGVSNEFIVNTSTKYINIKINVTDCDEYEIASKIREKLIDKDSLYRVELTGKLDSNDVIDLNRIVNALMNDVLFIKIKDRTTLSYDSNESGFKGILQEIVNERCENASEEEEENLKNALRYALTALEENDLDLDIEELL